MAPQITGILLDTTVLIDLSHGHEGAASFINEQSRVGVAMYISAISSMELIVGCFNKVEVNRAQKLIDKFRVLQLSATYSQMAYDLIFTYSKSHSLEIADALIAATAISHQMQLFTDNIKDFRMIPDLVVSRPY